MSSNHGFVDGNQRTAFMLFHLLLDRCGYVVHQTSTHEMDDIEHLILDVTIKFLDLEELTLWLKKRLAPEV